MLLANPICLFLSINLRIVLKIVLELNMLGRVHCFSMQIVMNKGFLLNPEKKFDADPSCRFQESAKTYTLIPKNDVTERLGYSNNQLSC